MKILAIDPGGSTGLASFNTETREWRQWTLREDDHMLPLWDVLWEERADIVIYENFIYQRRPIERGVTLVLVSRDYIGVIKLWHQMWHHKHSSPAPVLVRQKPADMQLWDDRKLRAVGLWTTDSPHARDATRHLLFWLTTAPEPYRDESFIRMTRRQ